MSKGCSGASEIGLRATITKVKRFGKPVVLSGTILRICRLYIIDYQLTRYASNSNLKRASEALLVAAK